MQESSLVVLKAVSKILLPLMIAFGLYIQIAGSSNPGGGFQAGAILASSIVLIDILFDRKIFSSLFSMKKLYVYASLGILIYLFPGLISIFNNQQFLNYFSLRFVNNPQTFGITIIEIGVGLTVFSSLSLIYLKFYRGNGEVK
ncbi:MAG: MnhB domain-containing protein [Rickettsiales bacterium]